MKEYETSEGEPFCKIDTLANGTVKNEISFVLRNDSLIMVMPKNEMIGMCRADGNWTSYAEATYKAVKLDNNTAAPSQLPPCRTD